MKKNVNGFIGLFAGIAAFVLIGIALFALTNPISGTTLALHGGFNVIIALVGAVLGIVAIVFGVMSRKDADKKGPRKAGVIVGVFAIIIALMSAGVCTLTKTIADYANNVPGNALSQMDNGNRAEMDKMIEQLRLQYPAEK
ncbi:MAG: hypothetical protein II517_01845 [Ruminococcus sp.]|nr:hypothetical protein [Ruminococcus sp.]